MQKLALVLTVSILVTVQGAISQSTTLKSNQTELSACGQSSAPGTFDNTNRSPGGGKTERSSNLKNAKSYGSSIASADQLINLGARVWEIVDKNKAVADIKNQAGTALPSSSNCWLDLEGWSRPQVKNFTTSLKNAYGVEVVRFNYNVLYVTGGSLEGRGRYIGFATIQPVNVSVAWGYKFSANVEVLNVMNMGQKSDPVAGMLLGLTYKIESSLINRTYTQSYFIDGLGHFETTK